MAANGNRTAGIILVATTPGLAYADTAQLNYWYGLIAQLTELSLIVFFVLGLFGFGKLSIVYAMQVLGAAKDSLGRRDMKPMNIAKFIAGIVLCSVLITPFSAMRMIGDISGLSSNGRPMCFVTGVSAKSVSWAQDASSCMDHVEERLKSVSGFTEVSKEGMDYVKLFFGIVQLSSVVFFGNSVTTLLRHVFGYRNIQVSVGGAFGAMTASSILFMLPNVAYYIQDVFATSTPVISTIP